MYCLTEFFGKKKSIFFYLDPKNIWIIYGVNVLF